MQATNLINALSNEYFDNLKEWNKLDKENEELARWKDEVEKAVAKLTSKLEKL